MSNQFELADPFPVTPKTIYPGEYAVSRNGRGIGDDGSLAPWPSIDKYPTVIGSSLTLTYLSATYRNAQTGYRREYVDVLDELLERDPHAFAVLSQRIIGVASGRLTMLPAKCLPAEEDKAKEIADDCERAIHNIEQRSQAFSGLLWGIFYGVSAAEINWRVDDGKWSPSSLSWIHSRRLAYPDPNSWAVKIWDLGMLIGWGTRTSQVDTQLGFGMSPANYPGKFIVHAPQLRGDYPTRDGLGREIAYWMAIKLMAARNFGAFVERFGKPWPIGYYNTTAEGKDHPRAADSDDKLALQATLQNLGAGNLNAAALPDSVRVDIGGPMGARLPAELPQTQLIRVCNGEISKAVLGQGDTTEAGASGARAATEVRKAGTIELYRYDAACLCDTLKRDLIAIYVHLNFPGFEHLTPTPKLDVEPPPDRLEESKIIVNMVTAGAPVDADAAAKVAGVDLIPRLDDKPRRLGLCIPAEPSSFDPLIEPPPSPEAPGNKPGSGDGNQAKPSTAKPAAKKPKR